MKLYSPKNWILVYLNYLTMVVQEAILKYMAS